MSTHDLTHAPPPVVIACAEDDLTTVGAAAEALKARGHEVDVVSDAGTEPELLVGALRRHDAEGLYVLCRSDSLDRTKIDKLRASLRSHDVPFGRTLTLALERGNARVLEDRIVSVVRRMVTGRPSVPKLGAKPSTKPKPPPVPTRPKPPPTPARASTPEPEGEPPVGAAEIAAWADSLANRAEPSLPDYAASEPTRFDGPSGDVFPVEELGGTPGDTTAKAPPATDDPWIPGDLPISDDARTQPLPQQPELVRELLADAEGPPPAPSGSRRPATTVTSPGPLVDDDGWQDNRKTALALTIGGGALVLLFVFGIFALRSDDEEGSGEETIAAETRDVEKPPTPQPAAPDSPKEQQAPAEPPSEQDASAAEAPSEPSSKDADVEPELEAEPEPKEIEPAGDPEPVEVDAAEVLAALESREVRALDTLVVTAERTSELTHAAALSHCETLVVAGLGGWRLPEIGELFSIGDANLLRRGIYWSETVGDVHGDDRLVYNTRRSRIAPVRKDWDGAHAVCVRPRS